MTPVRQIPVYQLAIANTEPTTGSHHGEATLILKETNIPVTTALPSAIVIGSLRNFCMAASVRHAAMIPYSVRKSALIPNITTLAINAGTSAICNLPHNRSYRILIVQMR